ncbi:glycosyltransferase [candidate division WWE3 bacterium]|nr:glycosyltransferase [candidate division WWE3 bacterium]
MSKDQGLPKVTVIITTYNDGAFVSKCLNNLKKIKEASYSNLDVIVKDQNTTDGTKELIKQDYPWVTLIEGENVGLSKAYNTSYRQADSEYLLFLGMDAFPEENAIKTLVDYFEAHSKVGAATCKLVLEDGSLDMDAHRAFPTPWISLTKFLGLSKLFPHSPLFNGYFLPGKDMEKPHEIDMLISHFMFTRKSVLDEVGGFDEDYFLYGEDVDICYRIKEAGWRIMYLPQCQAIHAKGGGIGIRKTTRNRVKKPLKHRLKMQRLSAEAMETFLRKHYMEKYSKFLVHLMIFSSRLLGKLRVFMESFR